MLEKWQSSTTCQFFEKCHSTSEKSHKDLQCVRNNCARFKECQPKGARGYDYTKLATSIRNTLDKLQSSTSSHLNDRGYIYPKKS
jgi:hypothetical protein